MSTTPWMLSPPLAQPQPQQGATLPPAMRKQSALSVAMNPSASGYPAGALDTPPATNNPGAISAYTATAPAMAGLQAGQMGAQAYDTKTGIAATLGAGATGAVTGAMVGGPVGALVGGGVGLAVGGLTAWMSVSAQNKARREKNRLLSEAKAEQNRRDKIARDDAIDGLAFERKQLKEEKQLQEWQRNRSLIAEARTKAKARADEYVARGYTT